MAAVAGREMVKLAGVAKIYGGGEVVVKALHDVNLCVEAGEFLALSGPSGSGKTTLLNIIGGLDIPSEGTVSVDGVNLGALGATELAKTRRDRIGFVFQAHNLFPMLTAVENAEFTLALQCRSKAERRERATKSLEMVGLHGMENRRPSQLSGGQQQRVAIARAIAAEPAIVLADEPTASLDSASAGQLIELMSNLNVQRQMTFIFSTHDQRILEKASRVVSIADGRVFQS